MKYFFVKDSLDKKVVGTDFPQAYKFIKGYNPMKYIDPDGRKIVIGTWWQRFMGNLGLDSYVSKVEKQFNMNNMDSRRIESTYNQLQKSELVYRVLPITESPSYKINKEQGPHVMADSKVERGKKQGATLYHDPDLHQNKSGEKRDARIALAHEMGHLEDLMNGKAIPANTEKARKGNEIERNKVELNETNSMELENIIRGILNYENRPDYFK